MGLMSSWMYISVSTKWTALVVSLLLKRMRKMFYFEGTLVEAKVVVWEFIDKDGWSVLLWIGRWMLSDNPEINAEMQFMFCSTSLVSWQSYFHLEERASFYLTKALLGLAGPWLGPCLCEECNQQKIPQTCKYLVESLKTLIRHAFEDKRNEQNTAMPQRGIFNK